MYLFIYIKSFLFKFEGCWWIIDEFFKYTYLKYITDLNFKLSWGFVTTKYYLKELGGKQQIKMETGLDVNAMQSNCTGLISFFY